MNDNTINFDETLPPGGNPSGRASLTAGDDFGQYKVVRLLGRGGMGEVYEVEHTTLRRRYALKLLPADFANRPGALERFKREAEVMANLEHPNIVKVDDFGEIEGRYWLRMELAHGAEGGGPRSEVRTLADYAEAQGGRLDPDEAAVIFKQILTGLAHAHEHGVVHRDLKPANILLFSPDTGNQTAETPVCKIADFGLVRMIGEEWLQSRTQQSVRLSMSVGGMETEFPESAGSSTRSLIGTYEYMSPEQKRGEEATSASDVYSVGLMMYRLLTGNDVGPRPPSHFRPELASNWDKAVLGALDQTPDQRLSVKALREGVADLRTETDLPTTRWIDCAFPPFQGGIFFCIAMPPVLDCLNLWPDSWDMWPSLVIFGFFVIYGFKQEQLLGGMDSESLWKYWTASGITGLVLAAVVVVPFVSISEGIDPMNSWLLSFGGGWVGLFPGLIMRYITRGRISASTYAKTGAVTGALVWGGGATVFARLILKEGVGAAWLGLVLGSVAGLVAGSVVGGVIGKVRVLIQNRSQAAGNEANNYQVGDTENGEEIPFEICFLFVSGYLIGGAIGRHFSFATHLTMVVAGILIGIQLTRVFAKTWGRLPVALRVAGCVPIYVALGMLFGSLLRLAILGGILGAVAGWFIASARLRMNDSQEARDDQAD